MGNQGVAHGLGHLVVSQCLDQDLPATGKLAAEDPMGPMSLVERPSGIFDGRAQVVGSMLVFEPLDTIAVGSGEQKANHCVVEATIDEIVDDRS